MVSMTLITVHSPDLVVKGKVGDHRVSELPLNTSVAAEAFPGPRNLLQDGRTFENTSSDGQKNFSL